MTEVHRRYRGPETPEASAIIALRVVQVPTLNRHVASSVCFFLDQNSACGICGLIPFG